MYIHVSLILCHQFSRSLDDISDFRTSYLEQIQLILFTATGDLALDLAVDDTLATFSWKKAMVSSSFA